ncbi:LexA repressor [compost metagenome]
MEKMSAFSKVFSELINKSELNDAEVARRLNVNKSTISRWKTGEQSPHLSKIKEISLMFGVNPLLFVGDELGLDIEKPIKTVSVVGDSVPKPLYGSISAGLPLEMIPVEDYIDVPKTVAEQYPNAFLLKVSGDSMNRVVPSGAYALITPCKEAANGDVVAVSVNGFEATLKRIYKLQNTTVLEPDSYNPEHRAQTYNSDEESEMIQIIGKLVWFMSPFNIKF